VVGSGGCSGCGVGSSYGYSGGGGCGCDSGCGGGGLCQKVHGRLCGGLFGGKGHGGGCDSCGTSSCGSTWGGHGNFGHSSSSSCGCESACGGHGGGFGGKLRGFFSKHHGSSSCDSCDSCGGGAYGGGAYGTSYPGTYGGVIVTTPGKTIQGGEPIGPPGGQPLPQGDKGKGGKNGAAPSGGEPPVNGGGTIAIPEAGNGQNLDIVPPTVVPNIPAAPGKSPF